MQTSLYSPPSHFARQPSLPGQRHWGGLSILALSSPSDDRGARAEPVRSSSAVAAADAVVAAARAQAYPSPPMSGSPPLPPKPSPEAGDRSKQRGYQATGYDAYRGAATAATPTVVQGALAAASPARPHEANFPRHHPDAAESAGYLPPSTAQHPYSHQQHSRQQQQHHPSLVPPHPTRPYPPGHQDRSPYPVYGRSEEAGYSPALASSQQQQQAMAGYPSYLPQLPGPSSMQQGYPPTCLPPAPVQQLPSPVAGPSVAVPDSPKNQRKTKGHVAAACVPCKRAHLRCDAQRPCSRCQSNGKENACIDVQHKKRGRPRLREERDLGYDFAGRGLSAGGHPADHRTMPLMYGPPPMGLGYLERAVMGADAGGGGYPVTSLSAPPLPPEPAAYLTMDLEIGNASGAFSEAIGRPATSGVHVLDIVAPSDRDRVLSLRRQMQSERQRKDPQYLPPIFVQRDERRVLQTQGFMPQDLAHFALDWHEFFTFVAADGQQRTFPVRLGLAKRDSIYFIVLLLQVATVRPPPRDYAYAYPPPQPPPTFYSQPPPISAAFDASRPGPVPSHHPVPAGGPGHPSPSAYGPPPTGRPEYGVGSAGASHPYPAPRGEQAATLGPLSHRQRQQQQQQQPGSGGSGGGSSSIYQLPPIRNRQHDGPPPRDDTLRVDIGGLLDPPDTPRRP